MEEQALRYAIVDLETTGGDFKRDRITEVAVIIHDGENELDRFESLVNPEISIPYFITKLTGINQAMIKDAPFFYEIAKEVVLLTEGCIFVAHNVQFDFNFLRYEYERLGYTYSRKRMCTVKLARKKLKLKSYGMDSLVQHFGITIENRHRAMGDAQALAEFFPSLIGTNERDETVLEELHENIKANQLPPAISLDYYKSLPQDPGVYYMIDDQDQIIYIGKSNNIKKRIYQHFNAKTKKSYQMYQRIQRLEYTLTGSTFIAELLEADEIKQHLPILNKAQRQGDINYASYINLYKTGHLQLGISKFNEIKEEYNILRYHSTKSAANSFRKAMEFQYQLCACIQYSKDLNPKSCLNSQMNVCNAERIENIELYNETLFDLISNYPKYPMENGVIYIDNLNYGKTDFILITNGEYLGFGTLIDAEDIIHNFEQLKDYLVPKKETTDVIKIIKMHLSKKRKSIRVFDHNNNPVWHKSEISTKNNSSSNPGSL